MADWMVGVVAKIEETGTEVTNRNFVGMAVETAVDIAWGKGCKFVLLVNGDDGKVEHVSNVEDLSALKKMLLEIAEGLE